MTRCIRRSILVWLTGLVVLVTAGTAAANRPFLVEDAILIPEDTFRLSAWHQETSGSDVRSSHLAGTMRGQSDWQFGLELASWRNAAGHTSDSLEFRTKTLFNTLEADGFGIGLAGGVLYDDDESRIDRLYVLMPFTIEPAPNFMRVHFNLGAERDRRFTGDREALFWGLATDFRLSREIALRFELFDDDRDGDADFQAGLNWRLGDSGFGINATVRRNLESGSDEIWSVGIGYRILQF